MKESAMESIYFIVQYLLKIKHKIIQTHVLINCGATGIAVVDKDFVCYHEIEEKELRETK